MSTTISTSAHGASPAVGRQPLAVQFLLAAGLVGPLFFFIVVLVEGATRPGYNAWQGVLAGLSNDPGSLFGLFQRLEFFTAVGWIALLAGRLLTGPAFEA
jgi:hypothetical protein